MQMTIFAQKLTKVLRMSTQFSKLLEIDKRMQKGVKTDKFYSKFLKIGDVKERNSTKLQTMF